VTSTLEQASPRSTSYGLAAALPLALAGLIITAVLTVVVGVIGLIVGLVITGVAVVVRMRTFAAGIDAAIIGHLGATPADGPEAAGLRNLAEGLSATAGVPLPELLILDTPSVNLLVVGTDAEHAAIIATSGLLAQLSRVELEGAVARAFVQLRQGDVFSATMGIRLEAAPATRIFASMLGHRSNLEDPDRDVLLDRSAVMLTRYPPGLVGALGVCLRVGSMVSAGSPSLRRLWLVDPLTADADALTHRMEALRLL
jgi:Zn-dependent protease with chaperone function